MQKATKMDLQKKQQSKAGDIKIALRSEESHVNRIVNTCCVYRSISHCLCCILAHFAYSICQSRTVKHSQHFTETLHHRHKFLQKTFTEKVKQIHNDLTADRGEYFLKQNNRRVTEMIVYLSKGRFDCVQMNLKYAKRGISDGTQQYVAKFTKINDSPHLTSPSTQSICSLFTSVAHDISVVHLIRTELS